MAFDLKTRLSEMGLTPKKSFGQNFLISRHVIEKTIQTARALKFNEVIEIGPGLGALTEPLLENGLNPRVIELDSDLVKYWRQRGVTVLEGDALKLNWEALNLAEPALLVSNLPYQISTHLVIDRCFGPLALQWMVLMFQKEVAQRLMAEPRTKEYGFLSVMAQLHFKMRKVTDAAPGDYFPPPKVAGRVLLFERILQPDLGQPFFKLVKQSFAFRRKFLLKNLKGLLDKERFERLPEQLRQMGLSEKVRAEELSPAHFVELFKRVYEH